jgi:hypothetical protein
MSCCLCTKKEKGADRHATYICSTCTYKLNSIPRSEVRTAIDRLYLANRVEDARFLERVAFGSNTISMESPKMLKRTVPLKIRKRSI